MVNPTVNDDICVMTQLVAIQIIFVMSFPDNFSQWNESDKKNQRTNLFKRNLLTVNKKRTRTGLCRYSFFYQ